MIITFKKLANAIQRLKLLCIRCFLRLQLYIRMHIFYSLRFISHRISFRYPAFSRLVWASYRTHGAPMHLRTHVSASADARKEIVCDAGSQCKLIFIFTVINCTLVLVSNSQVLTENPPSNNQTTQNNSTTVINQEHKKE